LRRKGPGLLGGLRVPYLTNGKRQCARSVECPRREAVPDCQSVLVASICELKGAADLIRKPRDAQTAILADARAKDLEVVWNANLKVATFVNAQTGSEQGDN